MSWLNNLFGFHNPADKANKYVGQIPGATNGLYAPWINAGLGALPDLQSQYGQLTSDPGGRLNKIGESYQQSPGFKFAMEQALQGGNHAAAAGGMAGSPMHEQQNMQLANNLANQDYNNWLEQATGMYKTGLGGQGDLAKMGQQSSKDYADLIAQAMAQQGNYAFRGQQDQNSFNNSLWSGLGKAAGGALGAFFPGFGGI
jgi:hypothetical protein